MKRLLLLMVFIINVGCSAHISGFFPKQAIETRIYQRDIARAHQLTHTAYHYDEQVLAWLHSNGIGGDYEIKSQ